MNTLDLLTAAETAASPSAPVESLALGVLTQAAHDLRKFHESTREPERDLYLDAYAWITTSDSSWPYSFVNICKLLGVSPQTLRAESLADASLGWLGHWYTLGKRFSHSFRDSLNGAFRRSCNGNGAALDDLPIYRLRRS